MDGTNATADRAGELTLRQTVLFASTYNFGTAVLVLSLPLRALELGANALHLGAIGGVFYVTLTLSAPCCGRLSDRTGRDRLMAAGALLCSLAALSIPSIPNLYGLSVAAAAIGLSNALYWPSMEARVADGAPDRELGGYLSRFNLSWGTGSAAGTFLAGTLAHVNLSLPFYTAFAVLFALAVRLVHRCLRPKAEASSQRPPLQPETGRPPEQTAAFLTIARLTNFAVMFTVASTRWLFSKLAVTLGITETAIGMVLGLLMGGQALMFFAMGRIRRWQYAFGAILLALLLPLVGLTLAWFSTTPLGFGVAFIIVGLSGGMAFTLGLFYSMHGSEIKGNNAGLHEAIMGCGSILGPFLGGLVARQIALPATHLLNLVVIVLTLAWIGLFWRRRRSRQNRARHIAA